MPGPTFVFSFLAVAGLVVNAAHAGQACDKSFFDSLNNDETLTHIQRLAAAAERCEGRAIVVEASIVDVDERKIELVGNGGLKFYAYVAQRHNCGDLVSLRKGQNLVVSGTIKWAYPHNNIMAISDSVCTR